MYGKKLDPHQAYEDRKRQIELIVKQMVFMSIAVTMYTAIEIVLASLDLRNLQPTVMSFYFQLLGAVSLRSIGIDNINFEVYKADPFQEDSEQKSYMVSEEKRSGIGVGLWIGLCLGLLFGVFILIEGGSILGFVMGAGIGMALGIAIGIFLDLRREASSTI